MKRAKDERLDSCFRGNDLRQRPLPTTCRGQAMRGSALRYEGQADFLVLRRYE